MASLSAVSITKVIKIYIKNYTKHLVRLLQEVVCMYIHNPNMYVYLNSHTILHIHITYSM